MPKTENMTKYVCDRDGKTTAYFAPGDATTDWHEVKYADIRGTVETVLLCSPCHELWKERQSRLDTSWNTWMNRITTDATDTATA